MGASGYGSTVGIAELGSLEVASELQAHEACDLEALEHANMDSTKALPQSVPSIVGSRAPVALAETSQLQGKQDQSSKLQIQKRAHRASPFPGIFYLLVYRLRHSICSVWMGLPPSKYPPEYQKQKVNMCP